MKLVRSSFFLRIRDLVWFVDMLIDNRSLAFFSLFEYTPRLDVENSFIEILSWFRLFWFRPFLHISHFGNWYEFFLTYVVILASKCAASTPRSLWRTKMSTISFNKSDWCSFIQQTNCFQTCAFNCSFFISEALKFSHPWLVGEFFLLFFSVACL